MILQNNWKNYGRKESNVIGRQNHYEGIIQRWGKLNKEAQNLQNPDAQPSQEEPVSAVSQESS